MTNIQQIKSDIATMDRRDTEDKTLMDDRKRNDKLTKDRRFKADKTLEDNRLRNDEKTADRREEKDGNLNMILFVSLLIMIVLTVSIFLIFIK